MQQHNYESQLQRKATYNGVAKTAGKRGELRKAVMLSVDAGLISIQRHKKTAWPQSSLVKIKSYTSDYQTIVRVGIRDILLFHSK